MKRHIFLIFFFSPAIDLTAQQIKWTPIDVDEVLTISLPAGFTDHDTSMTANGITVKSRLLQASTINCDLAIEIDSANKELKIINSRSAYIALQGIADGICKRYSDYGYTCQDSDTAINKVPLKKMLFFEKKDLAIINFIFRANNKTYLITSSLSNNVNERYWPSELTMLLTSIKFNTVNIKEYKYY